MLFCLSTTGVMAESEESRHLSFAGEFDCLPEPLPTLRHSTSHVMAQAVKRLFPEVKVAIGPAIEDGFYYDFLKAEPFSPEDLARIEATMREIVKADYPFTREEMPREGGVALVEEGRGSLAQVRRGAIPVHPRGDAAQPPPRFLRGPRRAVQGGDPARHRRAGGVHLPAGRVPRSLPRPATDPHACAPR